MSNSSLSPVSVLPESLLGPLHRALDASVSPETGVQILRNVGVEAARGVLDGFAEWCSAARMDSTPVEGLAEGEFWSLLSEFFTTQGFGPLDHEHLHAGIIAISSDRWIEAGVSRSGCSFTTGLLAELLRLIADREVAVFEVECRSMGSDACRFLAGSPAALETVYSELLSGAEIPRAVERLV